MQSALVIANPAAGRDSSRVRPENVARRLEAAGAAVELVLTEHPGHARGLAAAAAAPGGPATVVSVGGDGTVHDVAHGLVHGGAPDRRPVLLVLPGGTGNSFHRELWGDRSWRSTLDEALAGAPTRRIDLARIEETGSLAVLGACSGVVAQALVTVRGVTGVAGRDRYAVAVAETLRDFRPYPGRVLVDGEVVHEGATVLANVGGGRHRGGRFRLLPGSVLDDGLLDVCVVGAGIPLGDLPRLALDGGHVDRPEVVCARGRRITVERTDGHPLVFEQDGELVGGGGSRYTLDVLPGALPVLAAR
ncbi:diacylglycerol/lipid kinase family protein [Streptomyces sp. NPDC001380]|uniref:diacylglycerol/lipid kinase family protein n=1 Tax=Streptomyces sp. NPDC001380 TaxID=3364566 RepID=UPI0036B37DBE